MGYAVALTLAIVAALMYRTSSRVVFGFLRRRDPRFFIALPIAIAVIAWLIFAAFWTAGQQP